MSKINVNTWEPETGATITAGASGDTLAISADSVTGFNVGSDAQGDVLYHDGTDYTRLAAGTSGDFLKTQGAGANPVWAAAGGGLAGVQVYTASSSTWTKATRESALGVTITKVLVFITGGGGGGMYRSGDGGHGGGAAATAIKLIDVSSVASVDITIGSGGTGGSSSDPYNAPAGGASAFGVAPATVYCTAGGGGATSGTGVPGPGGTATGGDMNIVGGGGAYNLGGASFWGNGTNSRYSGGYLSPLANGIYGSGGGGARGAASGSGGDGVCLVLEYQ